MKNYYEILEVDKNASQEVIEKAYKTLAKKYHPDLEQGSKRQEYAEKMKIINHAYDILSDNFRRTEYDEQLKNEELQKQGIPIEEQERIIEENYKLKQQINKMEYQKIDEGSILNMSRVLNEQMRQARKHGFKYYLKAILIFLIIGFLCFLIYQIPPVKEYFQNLYNENVVFQAIIDIFKNTFSVGF